MPSLAKTMMPPPGCAARPRRRWLTVHFVLAILASASRRVAGQTAEPALPTTVSPVSPPPTFGSPTLMPTDGPPFSNPTMAPTNRPSNMPSNMPTSRPTASIPRGVGNRYAVEFNIIFDTTKNWVDVSSTPNDLTRTRFETEVEKFVGRYGGVNTDGSSWSSQTQLLEDNGDFYFEYHGYVTVRYESAEYWYVHDMQDELSRSATQISFGLSLGALLQRRDGYGIRGTTQIADVAYATATGVATNGGGFADDMFATVGPTDGSDNNNDASNDASSVGDDKDDNSFILYILIGLIGFIAIGGVFTILYLKKRKTQRRQAARVRKGRAVDNPTYANGRPEGNAGPKPRQGQGGAPGLGPQQQQQQQQQQQRAPGGQVQSQGGRKVLVLDPYGNDA